MQNRNFLCLDNLQKMMTSENLKTKVLKKFFKIVFPDKFSEKSVIMKTIKLAVKKWHIKVSVSVPARPTHNPHAFLQRTFCKLKVILWQSDMPTLKVHKCCKHFSFL